MDSRLLTVRHSKKIKLEYLLEDYLNGMTISQLSRKYNIDKSSVVNKLKPIIGILSKYGQDHLEYYKEKKAELLDAVQLQIIEEMANESKIKRANLKDLATAFEKLHIAGRLERNQSTENVSMKQESFVSIVQDLIKDKNIDQI